uniref:Uncharacterized protein n=1 Tax=Ananas comosus var. bracteatus TaxID=296719 RepID=A0A6V7NIJ2_ANACO|nr:unnamed protein product [Ananas comosus var. bracteatus]
MEKHIKHLRTIFQVLWENQLYVKKKYSFGKEEIHFLGHWIGQGSGYFARVASLTNIIKRSQSWDWTTRCAKAFEDLIHIGNIHVPNQLSLLDVYHVSKLSSNLLSIGQLVELDFKCIFINFGCQVKDQHTKRVIGIKHKVGRIFELTW